MVLLESFWSYVQISAPYLLLGYVFAAVLKLFLSMEFVKKHLSKDSLSAIVKASLFGVPLPLCSCSVIPTAVSLRKSGASKSATSAFLVSTPETGVDSVLMTYAMFDLPMTIMRPIAAFLSGSLAGLLNLFFIRETASEEGFENEDTLCCKFTKPPEENKSFMQRSKDAVIYSFHDLNNDLSFWLFVGLLLGAVIQIVFPEDFFYDIPVELSRYLLLFIGIPFYICASASTPIAAALVLKGLSPGAAMLFLLSGPATNLSNIIVLQKYIGKKGVLLNIIAVVVVALSFSYFIDYMYANFWGSIKISLAEHQHASKDSVWTNVFAVSFLLLLARGLYYSKIKKTT